MTTIECTSINSMLLASISTDYCIVESFTKILDRLSIGRWWTVSERLFTE